MILYYTILYKSQLTDSPMFKRKTKSNQTKLNKYKTEVTFNFVDTLTYIN